MAETLTQQIQVETFYQPTGSSYRLNKENDQTVLSAAAVKVKHKAPVEKVSNSEAMAPVDKKKHCKLSLSNRKKNSQSKTKVKRRKTSAPKSKVASQSQTSKSKPLCKSQLMTDFFPVRRSNRTTAAKMKKEKRFELEEAILLKKEEGLEVVELEGKGRGVVACKAFHRGDFVVEYAGDLVDLKRARELEEIYTKTPEIGCYMYYFRCGSHTFCIDATGESGRLGRLLNHSRHGNCTTKPVVIDDHPYLILIAKRDIVKGEELLYDYGDRNAESLRAHPWLNL